MNKIDEDGLRDMFIAHGAIPNKRFRKGKLNCTQLDTNSLIHYLAEITEECLLFAAGEAKPVEITEGELEEVLIELNVNYIEWDEKELAKAILTKLNGER